MPSKSSKQARFMAACSHNAGYASCPPQKVSEEFNQADKGTGILRHKVKGYFRGKGAANGRQHWSEAAPCLTDLYP